MAFLSNLRKGSGIFCLILAATLILSAASSIQAQIPDLTVDVGEVFATPGDTAVTIPVYLSNLVDDISGFNLWIKVDRPDLVIFKTTTDTIIDTTYWFCDQWDGEICIDSTMTNYEEEWDFIVVDSTVVEKARFDTTGTLSSGWDMVDASSLSGVGNDVVVAGLADMVGSNKKIPAGQQGGVLINLVLDVFTQIPDTLTARVVTLQIQTEFKDHFGFSTPTGGSIGWTTVMVEDTSCWICDQWGPPPYEDSCFADHEIPYISQDFCDWIETDLIEKTILDTVAVKVYDGSLLALIPPPPELDSIGPKTTSPESLLQFGVSASDPDETTPILTATPLPDGAIFVDNGDGTGQFDWTPTYEQLGVYEVMFYATDEITMGIDSELVDIQVSTYMCGNVDGLQPPRIDVADLVYMVKYMFHEGPIPPESDLSCDTDCNGRVDVADLVLFVNYMFHSGPDICDGC